MPEEGKKSNVSLLFALTGRGKLGSIGCEASSSIASTDARGKRVPLHRFFFNLGKVKKNEDKFLFVLFVCLFAFP